MVKRMLLGLFWGLLACGLITLMVGCGTKTVVVPETHWRDSVVVRLQRDSVFVRDSVWVDRWTHGDTVHVDKVRTRYLYRDRLLRDTVLVARRDTVSVVREVERPLRWHDRAARWLAAAFVGAVVGIVALLLAGRMKSD